MYGKIFRQMYKGTLAMVGPWEALVTFQQFIVLAERDGVVDMTADAISRETTIPLPIIQTGITALEQPDPQSRSPAEEGRRIVRLSDTRPWGWYITNYDYYRNLKREEERREYHRQYWHKRKTQQITQQLNTNSSHSTDVEVEVDAYVEENKKRGEEPRAARSAATRFPKDFELTAERKGYALAQGIDPAATFEDFRDYWTAASGARARKCDWDATWRMWCRRSTLTRTGAAKETKTKFAKAMEALDRA